ncbi:MAG: 2-oxoacid:ferredoxin oxidoreductase subunit gamma [Desulfobacula sp.]|jgi:2-oxoglutarate ferredoxin oxidoreductase subunit gamma|uniref:2-oxoacid:acceptor oxidoreductase family protein n=1 Tax=Desulfobacula sp. TaxID=2593537 RepID=UPI001D838873|nr:2-oxoacid:ferredoxin oxidoreductase subunit gamma [Desulfobacula sp.]MBT3487322.1 2-oxoacid:ferredoxin oxidoreductase subunit gamma [Desulfobacula sp.]MBT3807709.1 2-oxoacid:ferredoxin oxidoreductase subunit gamma [Desulfobacula sp.]MBT4027152.1 2-oxoacid:ferredoxin oxidoreductase subunit gamma [Desulfobacula sp.]MBT4199065.1 2-oxoacid:ferredoxin oxidoreductase subunit gamma [Desulfobacula sp.]
MERLRLVFSGSGGQGVITAAIILAKAAVLFENKNAIQSQSYGAAARGGATRSDIIIDDSQIYFPKVIQPNVLVSLTQESYNKFAPIIRPGGLLLVDSKYVTIGKKVDAKHITLPMFDTIMEKIGKPIVFNICMLGALIGISGLIKPESILKVLKTSIPEDFMAMNKKALDLGLKMGKKEKY